MKDTDRADFERILRELFGALDKPLTEQQRNAFWRGLARMDLVQFERCRDLILRELEDGEPPRRFGVDSIWAAKQRLRASGPPPPPKDDGWRGDKWDIEANRKMLGHITRTLATDSRRYGRPASYGVGTDASPEFVRNVEQLVAAKNRWAELMRASDEGQGVDVAEQNESWRVCIREAEAEIAARMNVLDGRDRKAAA